MGPPIKNDPVFSFIVMSSSAVLDAPTYLRDKLNAAISFKKQIPSFARQFVVNLVSVERGKLNRKLETNGSIYRIINTGIIDVAASTIDPKWKENLIGKWNAKYLKALNPGTTDDENFITNAFGFTLDDFSLKWKSSVDFKVDNATKRALPRVFEKIGTGSTELTKLIPISATFFEVYQLDFNALPDDEKNVIKTKSVNLDLHISGQLAYEASLTLTMDQLTSLPLLDLFRQLLEKSNFNSTHVDDVTTGNERYILVLKLS